MKFKLVYITWRDACLQVGRDVTQSSPGLSQYSVGLLWPKVIKDKHGKKYFRLLHNTSLTGNDDFMDIPVQWVVNTRICGIIKFDLEKVND